MARRYSNARSHHHKFLSKFMVAKILGIPSHLLTSSGGYVRKREYRYNMKTINMPEMTKMDIKVPADRVEKLKKHHEEMGVSEYYNVIPTDMYGNVETLEKDGNVQKIIEDRNKMHGLD